MLQGATAMKRYIREYLLALLFLMPTCAFAQLQVQTIFLRNPVPADFASWRNDPNIAQMLIRSDTTINEAFIGIEIVRNGRTVAKSKTDAAMRPYRLPAATVVLINQQEIQRSSSFDIDSSIRTQAVTTNMLPEGVYQYCVTVYKRNQTGILIPLATTNQQQRSCVSFQITIPERIRLMLPLHQTRLPASGNNVPVVFTWQQNSIPAARYRLVVVAMFQNQVEQQVLSDVFARPSRVNDPQILLDEIITNATTFNTATSPSFYPAVRQFINRTPCVQRFAWQVQLLDQNNRPIATGGASDGRSEIWTFQFQDQQADCSPVACSGAMQLQPYYPLSGDTIPWIAPPIIVRWGAFCSTMLGFDYGLKVYSPLGQIGDNARTLNWGGSNGSIFTAQGISTAPDREERAQIIITNWLNDAGTTSVPLNSRFRRGEQYSWTAGGNLKRGTQENHQTFSVNTNASFNIGLRMPRTPVPANESTIDTSSALRLKFTIPAPDKLMFDNPNIIALERSNFGALRFASAQEKIRVVVSRLSDCSSPVVSQLLTPVSGVMGSLSDVEQLSRDLFGEKTLQLSQRLAEGRYYWRVEYLDADNGDRVYRQGQIWTFSIRAGGGSSGGDAPITGNDCLRISPKFPEAFGSVSSSPIEFTVQIRPAINTASVRGGRFRVWELQSMNQNPSEVINSTPLYEATFSGSNERDFRLRTAAETPASASVWSLDFLNNATTRFTPRNNKIYVWQFALNIEGGGIRQDRVSCTATQILSTPAVFMYRTPCVDNCITAEPTNKTPAAQTPGIGSTLSIGNFRARLTAVSGTPSNLSGEAIVNVDAFRAGMVVEFRGVQVNSNMEVYAGEMTGKLAPNVPISPQLANLLQSTTRLTRSQIDTIHALASDASRIVSGFAGLAPMTLPIGIDRVIEGQRIVLGVMGMVFKPTEARMNVVLSFPMPYFGADERIGFEARNVCFSNSGIGRDFQIGLYNDLGFNTGQGSWAFHFLAPHNADPGTYAQFGCNGFEYIRVKGQLKFSRDCIRPVPDRDSTATVNLDFTTQIRADGNFIAFATMNRWAPVSLPDFQMVVDTIGIDFSEKENLPGMKFPDGYTGITGNAWCGFSMRRLAMQLPNSLRTFREGRLPNVSITGMLIDRSGLSMVGRAGSLIQYPQGNFSGWGASVDSLTVEIASNSLRRGEMLGRVSVPIFSQALGYAAVLSRNPNGTSNFDLGIRPTQALTAPLWLATFTLEETSYIALRYTTGDGAVVRRPDGSVETLSGGFSVAARLNGSLTIQGDAPSTPQGQQITGLNFRGIRFQNFVLSTHRDRPVETGTWSLASPQHGFLMKDVPPSPPEPEGSSQESKNAKSSGFPLSLDSIRFVSSSTPSGNPRIGIQFRISANLMGEQKGGSANRDRGGINALSGSTTLSVWGAMQGGETEAMSAAFDGVQMDEMTVEFDAGAVRMNGRVRFYNNDPTYGSGFRGAVAATFVKIVDVQSVVQFGSKPISAGSTGDFRYWYVDANIMLSRGLPVPGVPGVGIYGFGGGAWYNMTPDSSSAGQRNLSSRQVPAAVNEARNNAAIPGASPGTTNSGVSYTPFYTPTGATFGFFGQLTFGTYPAPEAFNCDLKLSFSFADGLQEIALYGQGYFFAKPTERTSAPVRLNVNASLRYNFPRTEFAGDFSFNLSATPITARGNITMLFNPTTWHIKAGSPVPNKYISMDIASLLTAKAYFMCGKGLEAPEALPEEFITRLINFGVDRSFLNSWQSSTRTLDSALLKGDGFALGAMATLRLGNPQSQDIFYAYLTGMLGFDISFLNYGSAARCSNSGRAIGWNGWYAKGQIYASIEAAVGVNVTLFGTRQQINIGSIGAGCALQGGMPNPEWFRAFLAGQIDILGGLIRGPFQFEVTIGEPCAMSTLLANVSLVSAVVPENNATDIPVDVQPQCITNFGINREFELTETSTNGITRTRFFRLTLPRFEVRLANDGKTLNLANVSDNLLFNSYRMVNSGWFINPSDANMAIARMPQPLAEPRRGRYAILVAARIEELDPTCVTRGSSLRSCNSWLPALQDGERAPFRPRNVDTLILSYFTVGDPPDYIMPSSVLESYPRNMQRYYLHGECDKGYVRALFDYDYLFNQTPPSGSRYVYKARFISLPNNQVQETAIWRSKEEIPLAVGQSESYTLLWNGSSNSFLRNPRPKGSIVHFTMPPLENNRIYAVQIVRRTEAAEEPSALATRRAIDDATASASLSSSLRQRALYSSSGFSTTITAQLRTASQRPNLGTAVQSNEKLLYVFFFRTSTHSTLAAKMSAITIGRATATPATVRSNQRGADALMSMNVPISGAELFDPAEVEQTTVNYQALSYQVPPLLAIDASTTASPWHTGFSTPSIYQDLQWLRSRFAFSTPNVSTSYFNQRVWGSNQSPWRASVDAAYENPLSQGEVTAVSSQNVSMSRMLATISPAILNVTSRLSGTALLPRSFSGSGTPVYGINFNHGLIIPLDFDEMKRGAALAFVQYTIPTSRLTVAEQNRLTLISGRLYQPPGAGTYQLDFKYVVPPPTECGSDVDNAGMGVIYRPFEFGTPGTAPR